MTAPRFYPTATKAPATPTQALPSTQVQTFRYARQDLEDWTAWAPYVPGTNITLHNWTGSAKIYVFQFMTQWLLGGSIVGEEVTESYVTVDPAGSLDASWLTYLSPAVSKTGPFEVRFEVLEPLEGSSASVSTVSYIGYKSDGSTGASGSVSASLISRVGDLSTYQAFITLPEWDYIIPPPGGGPPVPGGVQYGDLWVSVTASIPGNPVPPVSATKLFEDCWESKPNVPSTSGTYYLPNSVGATAWSSNTWAELSWTEVNVPSSSEDTSGVRLYIEGTIDSYPSEITVYMMSPQGTIVSIPGADLGRFESFAHEVIFSDFSGEDPSGNWRVWIEDSYGDGGCAIDGDGATMSYIEFGAAPPVGYPVPSSLGTFDYAYNSWTELAWTEVTVSSGESTNTVTLNLVGNIDSYRSEIMIYLRSPSGTVVSVRGLDLSGSTFDDSFPFSDFSGEPSGGAWRLWVEDSYGDGGCGLTIDTVISFG